MIKLENKIIFIFCIFIVAFLSINIMNSPQIYWFSRRFLPFIFVIFLFSIHYINKSSKINVSILIFLLLIQLISYKNLSNYSGIKKILVDNELKFQKQAYYFYDDTIDYREQLSFFQNIFNLKMIPKNQINNIVLDKDHFILSRDKCPLLGYKKFDSIHLKYNEIIHKNPQANLLLLQFPKLPKKYIIRNYVINICQP